MVKQWMFTLVPALIWASNELWVRPAVTHLRCDSSSAAPELCLKESVNILDRSALDFDDEKAEGHSHWTQNTAGVVAWVAPALWGMRQISLGIIAPPLFWTQLAGDGLILLQATLWNGAINSGVRLAAQRPRPFVYRNPEGEGRNPQNYTSFYSGHTSFAALAGVMGFFLLLFRGAPPVWLWIHGIIASGLVFSTALLRVFSGWHFPTDVVFGAIAGGLIGGWVVRRALRIRPK